MSIISTILRVESGGRNVTQGNIGDVNNRTGDLAQGYFQITDGTWRQFGGLDTGYSSAIQAPYATQLQVAENIPIGRWGPNTQSALAAAGYSYNRSDTLGTVLAQNGESPDGVAPNGNVTNYAPNDGNNMSLGPANPGDLAGSGASVGGGAGSVTTSGNPSGIAEGGDTQSASGSGQTGDWSQHGVVATAQGDAAIANAISGAAASAAKSQTTWLGSWLDNVKDLFIRAIVGILAIVLIGGALFLISKEKLA